MLELKARVVIWANKVENGSITIQAIQGLFPISYISMKVLEKIPSSDFLTLEVLVFFHFEKFVIILKNNNKALRIGLMKYASHFFYTQNNSFLKVGGLEGMMNKV